MEAVVGFSPDELMALDAPDGARRRFTPMMHRPCQAALARLEETGQVEAEYRQRTKSGDYRWLSNRMSLARNKRRARRGAAMAAFVTSQIASGPRRPCAKRPRSAGP